MDFDYSVDYYEGIDQYLMDQYYHNHSSFRHGFWNVWWENVYFEDLTKAIVPRDFWRNRRSSVIIAGISPVILFVTCPYTGVFLVPSSATDEELSPASPTRLLKRRRL